MILPSPPSTLFPYTTLFRSRLAFAQLVIPLHKLAHHAALVECFLAPVDRAVARGSRSEEHTSELQSRLHLVCRLLLEKKKHKDIYPGTRRYVPGLNAHAQSR